jgi:hypothetical protein
MSTYTIETGSEDAGPEGRRIYADISRNGRHWHRLTGNGLRPFESAEEASRYARKFVKRYR